MIAQTVAKGLERLKADRAWQRWLRGPGWGLLGYLSAAGALDQYPAGLAGCAVLAASGTDSLFAAAGAALGILRFWGTRAGAESLVQVVAAVVAACLPWSRGSELLRASLGAAIRGILGAAFLFSETAISAAGFGVYLMSVALCFGATWGYAAFDPKVRGPGDWMVALCLGLSLSQLWWGQWLRPGAIGAGLLILTVRQWKDLPTAAAFGLGLDLSGTFALPMTAVLCLGAVTQLVVVPEKKALRFAGAALWCYPVMYATKSIDLSVPLGLMLGAVPALLVPPKPKQADKGEALDPRGRLEEAAAGLERLGQVLKWQPEPPDPAGELYDRAAALCCRDCGRYDSCWNREGARSYRWLQAAAPGILRGDRVEADDLPGEFLSRCGRSQEFVEAVNLSLQQLKLRQQYRRRWDQAERALERQYGFLARYLRDLALDLDSPPPPAPRFRPEVGVSSRSRLGLSPCGDTGAHFSGPDGKYYVLLCDGMGTGHAAARESDSAVRLLTGLLRAGIPPEHALDTYNTLCVLRQSPGFATADLLELRLDTGRGVLYKWGGAPSFIKQRHIAKKIGTAGPPPGLELGGQAEVIRLSMQRGEMTVLATDGAVGERFRETLAASNADSCQALAEQLAGSRDGEDDATVAAIRLRPLTSST